MRLLLLRRSVPLSQYHARPILQGKRDSIYHGTEGSVGGLIKVHSIQLPSLARDRSPNEIGTSRRPGILAISRAILVHVARRDTEG